eukprot:Gb_36042 [translate_table: standard]
MRSLNIIAIPLDLRDYSFLLCIGVGLSTCLCKLSAYIRKYKYGRQVNQEDEGLICLRT